MFEFYTVYIDEEKKILSEIGNKVKAFRKKNGLSQFDLGIAADIPKNQVGRIERAEINTSILTLHKIAKVFKTNVKAFLD